MNSSKKSKKIGITGILLGIVLSMAVVTMAVVAMATEVGPCVIGVDSPCNDIGVKGVNYPKPPTPMSAAIDMSDMIENPGGVSDSPLYGTDIFPNGKVIGVYAGQEVRPELELPSTDKVLWFYAPTMAAPNYNPIEVVTAYVRAPGDLYTTSRSIWVWDHSKTSGNHVVSMDMNSEFLGDYTAKFNEGQLYFVTIMKYNREWQALLYNFKKSKWDKIYSTRNISKAVTNGWDSWETKNFNGVCPYVPEIESVQLKVYDKGGLSRDSNGKYVYTRPGWYLVNDKYGKINPAVTGGCNYVYSILSPYYHWQVSSPDAIALNS